MGKIFFLFSGLREVQMSSLSTNTGIQTDNGRVSRQETVREWDTEKLTQSGKSSTNSSINWAKIVEFNCFLLTWFAFQSMLTFKGLEFIQLQWWKKLHMYWFTMKAVVVSMALPRWRPFALLFRSHVYNCPFLASPPLRLYSLSLSTFLCVFQSYLCFWVLGMEDEKRGEGV